MNKESLIHKGHRQRMKEKFISHGRRIFDTYELLEMLLYFAIPYKDTNPLAKTLLSAFGSLDGVLRAQRDELVAVEGIGVRAAELISLAGELSDEEAQPDAPAMVFDNYYAVGYYFVDYFQKNPEVSVAVALLDNGMRLISTEALTAEKFGTAAVKSTSFIDPALRRSASVVIIGYTHKYGPLFPLASELVTSNMICSDLAEVGVEVAEEFIVSGSKFVGISRGLKLKLSYSNQALMRFVNSCIHGRALEGGASLGYDVDTAMSLDEEEDVTRLIAKEPDAEVVARVRDFISFAMQRTGSADAVASSLVRKYGGRICNLSIDDVEWQSGMTASASLLVALLGAVASRRISDGLKLGRKYTEEEIKRFVRSFFIGLSVETVYMFLFDKHGSLISVEYMGEGTVNNSDIYPRRLLERAVKKSASGIYLAHNHPKGKAEPSERDIYTTAMLKPIFRSAGVELLGHFVVSDREVKMVGPISDDWTRAGF